MQWFRSTCALHSGGLCPGCGRLVYSRARQFWIPALSFDPACSSHLLGNIFLISLPSWVSGGASPCPPQRQALSSPSKPYGRGHTFSAEPGKELGRSSGLGGAKSELEARLYRPWSLSVSLRPWGSLYIEPQDDCGNWMREVLECLKR